MKHRHPGSRPHTSSRSCSRARRSAGGCSTPPRRGASPGTVSDQGPLPARKAIDYAVQIARGLAAAHEKGIVHRDLKPENIFVTADGRVKILDFGLAKLTEIEPSAAGSAPADRRTDAGRDTLPGVVLGTVGYMSPEQVRGVPADHRSDIFSLGAILYEMLAGHRAFRGETAADTMGAILSAEPPDLQDTEHPIPVGAAPHRRPMPGEDSLVSVPVGERPHLCDGGVIGPGSMPRTASARRRDRRVSRCRGLAAALLLLAAVVVFAVDFSGREVPVDSRVYRASNLGARQAGSQPRYAVVRGVAGWPPPRVCRSRRQRTRDALGAAARQSRVATTRRHGRRRGAVLVAGQSLRRVRGRRQAHEDRVRRAALLPPWRRRASACRGRGAATMRFSSRRRVTRRSGACRRRVGGRRPRPRSTPTAGETAHAFPVFLPDGRRFLYRAIGGAMPGLYAGSLDSPERTRILDDAVNVQFSNRRRCSTCATRRSWRGGSTRHA